MESYAITWRKSTKKDLRKIPEGDVLEILAAIEALAEKPFPIGSMKLSGTQDVYRIRLGKYRVIYDVKGEELVIEVIRVGSRGASQGCLSIRAPRPATILGETKLVLPDVFRVVRAVSG